MNLGVGAHQPWAEETEAVQGCCFSGWLATTHLYFENGFHCVARCRCPAKAAPSPGSPIDFVSQQGADGLLGRDIGYRGGLMIYILSSCLRLGCLRYGLSSFVWRQRWVL